MAFLAKFSPVLYRSLCRPGCLQANIRPVQLHGMALRNFAATASWCQDVRRAWNLRSVTGSRVVSRVPYRIAATWLIPDPTNVRPEQVIRRFPRLDPEHHMALQNVVFLVTPAFAGWLGANGSFLTAALQHIYGDFTYHDNMRNIQSAVAVVDRLPSPARVSGHAETAPNNGQIKSIHGHEGIALWIDSMRFGLDTVPSFSHDNLIQPLVRAVFMRRLGGGTAVELQPANTLFVNGSQSTMFQDSWAINPFIGPKVKQIGSRQPLKTLEIFDAADAPDVSAPIEALTGRREILSSMGNIIRQLKSQNDGEPVPASAELEEKVPQYLARRRGTDGTLVVFALVLPPGVLGTSERDGFVEPSKGSLTQADLCLLSRALLEGAHLHRVTSGGGGWGKKQGLLSLDPSFDFTKREDTGSLDAMLEWGRPRDGVSAMNAVNPGDFVQFFASYEPENQVLRNQDLTTIADVDTSNWDAMRWVESNSLETLLGSLPSQDDILVPSQSGKQLESRIIGIPGYFGMLSTGGTCLRRYKFERGNVQADLNADENGGRRGQLKQVALSRMDIPYGSWNARSANQRLSPSITPVPITASSGEEQS